MIPFTGISLMSLNPLIKRFLMFSFFSADILIAVMFLGQHEKEVFVSCLVFVLHVFILLPVIVIVLHVIVIVLRVIVIVISIAIIIATVMVIVIIVAHVYREDIGWEGNTLFTGDIGEGGAKDQECAGRCKGLGASILTPLI